MPPPTLFVLKRAYQAIRNALEAQLRSRGLTTAQFDVLKLLLLPGQVPLVAGGLDQRVIQADLGITSATLTRLLAGMEARGLIRRLAHPQDSRSKRVTATAKARALVAKLVAEEEADFYARVFRGFSETETRSLTSMLGRVAENLRPSAKPRRA